MVQLRCSVRCGDGLSIAIGKLRLGWYNVEAMTEEFFQLHSPRDMLEKAKREFGRMKSSPNIDTVFNFYVTAYHVKDYVEGQSGVLGAAIKEEFKKDQGLRMCDYICHKGKHLELKAKKWAKDEYKFKTRYKLMGVWGQAPWGAEPFGGGESYRLVVDGEEIDVIELGQRVLEKWERFFKDNGI